MEGDKRQVGIGPGRMGVRTDISMEQRAGRNREGQESLSVNVEEPAARPHAERMAGREGEPGGLGVRGGFRGLEPRLGWWGWGLPGGLSAVTGGRHQVSGRCSQAGRPGSGICGSPLWVASAE